MHLLTWVGFGLIGYVPNTLYIHTYHSRMILEGVAYACQIFLQDAHVFPKLVSYEEHCRRDRWKAHRGLIAVYVYVLFL
jgi:hypothetical protein